jgi:hypothetical protein
MKHNQGNIIIIVIIIVIIIIIGSTALGGSWPPQSGQKESI